MFSVAQTAESAVSQDDIFAFSFCLPACCSAGHDLRGEDNASIIACKRVSAFVAGSDLPNVFLSFNHPTSRARRFALPFSQAFASLR